MAIGITSGIIYQNAGILNSCWKIVKSAKLSSTVTPSKLFSFPIHLAVLIALILF